MINSCERAKNLCFMAKPKVLEMLKSSYMKLSLLPPHEIRGWCTEEVEFNIVVTFHGVVWTDLYLLSNSTKVPSDVLPPRVF